jgi:hypothetical protein
MVCLCNRRYIVVDTILIPRVAVHDLLSEVMSFLVHPNMEHNLYGNQAQLV